MLPTRSGRRPRLRLFVIGLTAASVAALTVSCSDAGSVEGDASDEPTAVTSQDATGGPDPECAGIISDDVVTLLRWAEPGAAVQSAGRCERGGADDLVTVGADPTVRPDAGSDDVQAAYVDACQSLSGDQVPQEDPDWLDEDASACVLGLDGEATSGFVEFYTVSDTGWLVHGQVAQSTEVDTDDFRAAVSGLVVNATAADWG